jgi:hypothetical protein
VVVPEGVSWSAGQRQNGHHDEPDHVVLAGADEVRGSRIGATAAMFGRGDAADPDDTRPIGDPGRPLRDATSLNVEGRQAEDLLFRVRAHAESLAGQAQVEAEELLSRAQAQAELLRVHAEAMRAEAECMRAEAGALRAAVREEADAAASCADSVTDARAAAEELRAAMQLEAVAAREEFEQMRAETLSIRRLLRAEIDAGLADAERLRGEVRRLCHDANQLAAELGQLFAPATTVDDETGTTGDAGRPTRHP